MEQTSRRTELGVENWGGRKDIQNIRLGRFMDMKTFYDKVKTRKLRMSVRESCIVKESRRMYNDGDKVHKGLDREELHRNREHMVEQIRKSTNTGRRRDKRKTTDDDEQKEYGMRKNCQKIEYRSVRSQFSDW